jgi:hypothetical protein
MSSPRTSNLVVLVDGELMEEAAARQLWMAFSRHMDEHRGDTAGFAKARGWFNISPEHHAGQAVLVVQTVEGALTTTPAAAPQSVKATPKRRPKSKR